MPTSMASEFGLRLKSSSAVLARLSGPFRLANKLPGRSQPGSAPTPVPSFPRGVKLLASVESKT